VIPAAVADSWLFWLAIIDGLAAIYILPTVIAIARQVEGLGLVICLKTIPVGWPAALLLACGPAPGLRPCSWPAALLLACGPAPGLRPCSWPA
jgi:hypothetical protein